MIVYLFARALRPIVKDLFWQCVHISLSEYVNWLGDMIIELFSSHYTNQGSQNIFFSYISGQLSPF